MPLRSPAAGLIRALAFAAAFAASAAQAAERQTVRIVGSSTMYAYLAAAAENFGRDTPFRAPVIEATGTVGGFKIFCSDLSLNSPDIVAASRRITPLEEEHCLSNNIADVAEFKVGYDGIVVARSLAAPPFGVTRATLWRALARSVKTKTGLAANPYRIWSDIVPTFPATPIRIYGPPLTSGTRDVFVHLVMNSGCEDLPMTAPDSVTSDVCGHIREDGAYIDAGEDDELIVRRLLDDSQALGIMGYGALKRHDRKLQGLPVEGVRPTADSLEDGSYPLSRPLYLYVKVAHVGRIPGVLEFVRRFLSDDMIGEEGRLVRLGLIPMRDDEREFVQDAVKALETRIRQ